MSFVFSGRSKSSHLAVAPNLMTPECARAEPSLVQGRDFRPVLQKLVKQLLPLDAGCRRRGKEVKTIKPVSPKNTPDSVLQTLYLNASESVDEDQSDAQLQFKWNCTDEVGTDCMSSTSAVLDLDSFASGGLLTIPAGTFPSGKWNSHVQLSGSE